ncbi:hypothetical protein RCH09_002594 [Actimicrobium sp. GrIS 1.19]|uniref:hypothetical protein n=1 Tax=Actimicrobium sp. GrIS 1.19 TaxID=3071708 RepID=UPI002E0ADFB3|nr:hypothetical protein [Actimicrobium sp. GrIS 1.19]
MNLLKGAQCAASQHRHDRQRIAPELLSIHDRSYARDEYRAGPERCPAADGSTWSPAVHAFGDNGLTMDTVLLSAAIEGAWMAAENARLSALECISRAFSGPGTSG